MQIHGRCGEGLGECYWRKMNRGFNGTCGQGRFLKGVRFERCGEGFDQCGKEGRQGHMGRRKG